MSDLTFLDGLIQGPPGPQGPAGPSGGGGEVVASFYSTSETDLSTVPALNGVFYTVPSGGAGLYRYTATFTTPGAFSPGVDSAQVGAYLNGAPGLDTVLINEATRLNAGGEGTQASLSFNRPVDLLLRVGDTIQLTSNSGGTVSVLVRLEKLDWIPVTI
jgi:hypothetical protein